MAGSYNHIVKKNGNIKSNSGVVQALDNRGDIFEAIEEMYGMIWWLASEHTGNEKAAVEDARKNYREGLKVAKKINDSIS